MIAEDGGRDARFAELYAQAQAARARSRALRPILREKLASIEAERERLRAACEQAGPSWQRHVTSNPGLLRYSAYARLQARLATMPQIEQAKGIIMAQTGWPAERAFDALRQASQRQNVKVRVLAERIVAATTCQPGPRPLPPDSMASGPAITPVPQGGTMPAPVQHTPTWAMPGLKSGGSHGRG